MCDQATPSSSLPPVPPAAAAIPDDLIIARWIDAGDLGDERDKIDTFGDVLEVTWEIATRLGRYPDTSLFAAEDGRLYAVEGCVFGRRASREGEVARDQSPAASTPRPFTPPVANTISDHLGVADVFCPGLCNPVTARTVGELKRKVWHDLVEVFGGSPPVSPVVFVGEDGGRYVVEFGLRVRPASMAEDRAAIEWEQRFLRDEAEERIKQLDGYLEQMGV